MTSVLISLFGLCNCWRQYLDSLKVHANFLLKQAWLTCQSRGPCICDLWWSARCGGRPWNSCEGEHPFSASPHSSSFPYRRSTVRYPCPRPACTVSASFPWMAKSVLSWCAGTHIGIPKSLLIYPYSFMSRLTFIWGSAVDLFYSAPRVFSVDFVGRRFSELARGVVDLSSFCLKWLKDVQLWLYTQVWYVLYLFYS